MVRESHFKNRYTALDDTHSTYNKKCSTFKITINKIVRGQGRLLIICMLLNVFLFPLLVTARIRSILHTFAKHSIGNQFGVWNRLRCNVHSFSLRQMKLYILYMKISYDKNEDWITNVFLRPLYMFFPHFPTHRENHPKRLWWYYGQFIHGTMLETKFIV